MEGGMAGERKREREREREIPFILCIDHNHFINITELDSKQAYSSSQVLWSLPLQGKSHTSHCSVTSDNNTIMSTESVHLCAVLRLNKLYHPFF